MRTLFISGVVPWPLDNGARIRVYHLLRAVARVSDVTLVCFTSGQRDLENLTHLADLTSSVHTVARESCRFYSDRLLPPWARRLRSLKETCVDGRPELLRCWESEAAVELMHGLNCRHFDVVWGETLGCLRLLEQFPNARRMLDLYDVEHSKAGRAIRVSRPTWKTVLRAIEREKLRRLERGLLRRGIEVLVCSANDRRLLGEQDGIHIVPNGVALPENAMAPAATPAATYLFAGTLNYAPNVDAVHYFCRRILPLIHKRVADARVVIAGRDPDPSVWQLDNGRTILVKPDVPDMATYLRGAMCAIVPIRIAGGTRLKILEAFAHCVPVVSTTIGAEGIEANPGEHLLLADTPDAFARACVQMQDDHLRARLAASAYALVREKYEWSRISETVASLLRADAQTQMRTSQMACQWTVPTTETH